MVTTRAAFAMKAKLGRNVKLFPILDSTTRAANAAGEMGCSWW